MQVIAGLFVIAFLIWTFAEIKWLIGLLILIAIGVYALLKSGNEDPEKETKKLGPGASRVEHLSRFERG